MQILWDEIAEVKYDLPEEEDSKLMQELMDLGIPKIRTRKQYFHVTYWNHIRLV